ncbi:MAG: RidA family protein [Acidimicrobiales bacterium]
MSAPVGPYSPVVRAGGWLVTSGQIGLRDGAVVAGGVRAQTVQALANLRALLECEGASLAAVVKTTVFLTDMADFAAMNAEYATAFGDHRPARSTVGVAALPLGAVVEVEAWAHDAGDG